MNRRFKVSAPTIQAWLDQHNEKVVKETPAGWLMHCINPLHVDHNRSAVLYRSGRYVCPKCGVQTVLEPDSIEEYIEPNAPLNRFCHMPAYLLRGINPKQYYIADGDVFYVNADIFGNVVGSGTRYADGTYLTKGKPGFRLWAKFITESLSDAVTLAENNVMSGSICSVAQANKFEIKPGQMFIPQYDKPGINCAIYLQSKGMPILWWQKYLDNPDIYYKDICDLPESELDILIALMLPS